MELTALNVQSLMRYCLYDTSEVDFDEEGNAQVPEDAKVVEGIGQKFGLHPGRIEERKEDIRSLLNQTSAEFHRHEGGGMSFLKLPFDKNDNHWGGHTSCEALVCLGLAAGMASYCMPRDMWYTFPGGLPYVVFDTSLEEPQKEAT